MRKHILLLLLLLPAGLTFGQMRKAKQRWDWGFFYLPEKTGITNSLTNKKDQIYQNRPTFAGGFGMSITYWKNSGLGFQTGLMYASHNQKFFSEVYQRDTLGGGTFKTIRGKKRLDYLSVPLFIVTNAQIRRSRMSVTTFFGPQFSYLLKGDGGVVVFKHNQPGESDFYDLPVSSSGYYNKYLIEVAGGMGLTYIINTQFSFTTAIRGDYSLSDVENKKFPGEEGLGENALHYTYSDPNRKKAHKNSIGILFCLNYTIGGDHLLLPSKRFY